MLLRGILIRLLLFSYEVSCESGTDINNIMTKLFVTDGYNKKIRPLINQSETLEIFTDYFLNAVIEFDEQAEVLKTSGYMFLTWTDEYLTWTPSSFNGTSEIYIPQDDVWKPDISLRNTYKSFTGLGSSYLNVKVQYNGTVDWVPYQILESTCTVNIKYFPFDKQICDIRFTAWSYDKTKIDLDVGATGVALDDYVANAQWDLTSTFYKELNTDEAAVIFSIELTRKSIFYVINIIVPVVLLSILNIGAFLLPVASGEKASYAVTVFLSLAVFLTIIASQLPKNSDVVSLMSVYLTLMISLSTIIVMISLLEIRLASRTVAETPVNFPYQYLIKLTYILRCKNCSSSNVRPMALVKDGSKPIPTKEFDWTDVVNAIDFVSFWLSLTFTFLCTAIIFNLQ